MHQLQRPPVTLSQIHTSRTRTEHLLEKRPERRPTLMIHKRTHHQTQPITSLLHLHAKINILTITHPRKTSHCLKHIPPHTHTVTPRIKPIHTLLTPTPYPTSRPKRRHRIRNSLLDRREKLMRLIPSPKTLRSASLHIRTHTLHEIRRQSAVRIKKQQPLTTSHTRAPVPRSRRTTILLPHITHIQLTPVTLHCLLTHNLRPILHHYHLRLPTITLQRQRVQQLLQLLRPVIHRHYHTILNHTPKILIPPDIPLSYPTKLLPNSYNDYSKKHKRSILEASTSVFISS